MKSYYRVVLGPKSAHAEECFKGNFIGTDFGIAQDLTGKLPDGWRAFNKVFIPVYLAAHPEKSKISAGLTCAAVWIVSKGVKQGDYVVCPDGTGKYRVGEVNGDYYYEPGKILPHRRSVVWLNATIERTDMSDALRRATAAIGTVGNISQHSAELDQLLGGAIAPKLVAIDPSVEDAAVVFP